MLMAAGSTTTSTSQAPTSTVAFHGDDLPRLFTHAVRENQNSAYTVSAAHHSSALPVGSVDPRLPAISIPISENPMVTAMTSIARNPSFVATMRRADTGWESVSARVPCSRSPDSTLKLKASTSRGSR